MPLDQQERIAELAKWVLKHPLIRMHYALGGGSWLTLRLPKKARESTDVDVFSDREDISSYKAMMELVESCKRQNIKYTIIRRGEHFCQLMIEYPDAGIPIKVDIGKIWRTLSTEPDRKLGYPVLGPADMVLEKLHCIVNRIEPADLYDLCVLFSEYPEEFQKVCEQLRQTDELSELLVQINIASEKPDESTTKLKMTPAQIRWLRDHIGDMVAAITRLNTR